MSIKHTILAAIALPGLLAACTAATSMAGPNLTPAPLPQVRVGDTYHWDNGYVERVVGLKGEVVEWQDGDGNRTSAYRNFALPALAWDWPDTRATTQLDTPPDTLWPLAAGRRAAFPVTQRVTRKIHQSESTFRDEWECTVQGTEAVTVPAGSFDTWRLRCIRFWNGSWMDDATWNYAPKLGAVVRRKFTAMDKPEELVAFLPGGLTPSGTRKGLLDKVLHRGLESLPSGQSLHEAAEGMEVTLTPVRTTLTDKNIYCRDFREEVAMDGMRSVKLAVACRNGQGRWEIPGEGR